MSNNKKQKEPLKWYNFAILSLSAGFLIIGVHQTLTVGFEVSYWLFMLSVSLFLLHWMVKNTGKEDNKKKKKGDKKESKSFLGLKKPAEPPMNRRAKRYMNKMK